MGKPFWVRIGISAADYLFFRVLIRSLRFDDAPVYDDAARND